MVRRGDLPRRAGLRRGPPRPYNCLTFCDEALAAGGIHLLTESGRELHTIVPKDAFRDVDRVEGAHPFEAWKYWFPLGEPPSNGLRTIQDVPGRDKPLE